MIPNTPAQKKEKSISRKKNTIESRQIKLITIEKESEEKVLEIQMSLQNCIIYNTCKI